MNICNFGLVPAYRGLRDRGYVILPALARECVGLYEENAWSDYFAPINPMHERTTDR